MSLFKTKKTLLIVCFTVSLVVLAFDQLTKYWVVSSFQDEQGRPILYEQYEVTSFFKITRRHNCGVAFSMGFKSQFHDCRDVGKQRWILAGFVFAVSVGIAIFILRITKEKSWEALGLAFILGGALGNLFDRVVFGYVVDFIVVHHEAWPWPEFPSFNIADSAITLGAGLLIIDMLFIKNETKSGE